MSQPQARPKVRVIDSLWTFFIAVALVGPFALPLLWRNPRFTAKTKILGSVVIALVTLGLMWMLGKIGQQGYEQYQELQELMKQ